MLINLLNLLFRNDEGRGKVIVNPNPGAHHQQKLTISSDWQAQSKHQVSMKSTDYFCSNPAHRPTDRMTENRPDCISLTWPNPHTRTLYLYIPEQ